jgi:hypothetical protein
MFGQNYFDHELGVLENVRNLHDLENDGDMYMDDVYYGDNDYLDSAYEDHDDYY